MKKQVNGVRINYKIAICILIIVLVGLTGCSNKEKVPNGDYVMEKADGSQSVITIEDDKATFSNIDIEKLTSQYADVKAFLKKQELESEGEKVSDEDVEKLAKEYSDSVDFETLFQNQTVDFIQEYDKNMQTIYASVVIKDDDSIGFGYDIKNKKIKFCQDVYVKK